MAFLAVLAIVAMVIATMADVGRRAITGRPIAGVFELGEVMMVAIVFLSLGFAETSRSHIAVTLLTSRLPRRLVRVLTSCGLVLVIGVVTWMVLATAQRALIAIEDNEFRHGLIAIPIWPARVLVVFGLIGFLLELIFRLIDTAFGWSDEADSEAIPELGAELGELLDRRGPSTTTSLSESPEHYEEGATR
jgi:TRAP-type C4-dicarboxylate transport system permease small subunit